MEISRHRESQLRLAMAQLMHQGKYTGYKPRGYWDIAKGVKDNVESFNYYSETMCDGTHLPECLRDCIDDIREFNAVSSQRNLVCAR